MQELLYVSFQKFQEYLLIIFGSKENVEFLVFQRADIKVKLLKNWISFFLVHQFNTGTS